MTKSREKSEKITTLAKKEPETKVANYTDKIAAAAREAVTATEEGISDEQKTCEMVSLENFVDINRPYLDLLLNMSAQREHDILEEDMQRVFQNKLSGYTRTGRDRLASPEGACWEQAYVPLYVEYRLSGDAQVGYGGRDGNVGRRQQHGTEEATRSARGEADGVQALLERVAGADIGGDVAPLALGQPLWVDGEAGGFVPLGLRDAPGVVSHVWVLLCADVLQPVLRGVL